MTLQTERLILRPWEESDAEALFEYARDDRIGPITGWPVHTSVENSLDVIRNVLSAPETYAVCLKDGSRPIGDISLMIGKNSNMDLPETEAEIGFWLGVPYWGQGLIPEAAGEIIRHAFRDLRLERLWCGYFEGNEPSRRVQEKVGFVYHHTNRDIYWQRMQDIRTEHISVLSREDWLQLETERFRIVRLSERRDLAEQAARWYSSKWHVPEEAYRESIQESFHAVVPSWYVCLEGDRIIAGMGVIENDFHERTDLTPNVCAVYTEPAYRCRGIAGRLLDTVANDMASHGIGTLYLVTDHTDFYERYGWEFLCMVRCEGEEELSRMYIHRSP